MKEAGAVDWLQNMVPVWESPITRNRASMLVSAAKHSKDLLPSATPAQNAAEVSHVGHMFDL